MTTYCNTTMSITLASCTYNGVHKQSGINFNSKNLEKENIFSPFISKRPPAFGRKTLAKDTGVQQAGFGLEVKPLGFGRGLYG